MGLDDFKSIEIFDKYSLDVTDDPEKLTALEYCLKFVDVDDKKNSRYNHNRLKRYIGTYPSLMGSALRILHDETELEITKYDSDTIPEYLSEVITDIDGFVDHQISELQNYKSLYGVASIVCVPLILISIISSIQNYKTLSAESFLTIPITFLIGTYTNLEAIKALRTYNAFESAYNEK